MKMTATEKILATHAGLISVKSGDMLLLKADLLMANDITAPVAIREFSALNRPLFDATQTVFVLDHFVPNKDVKSAEQCKTVRDFAKEHGIKIYDVGCMGIEHALLPEQGHIVPSSLVVGADSHTCTYGALGCFSTGVGSTDIAAALATGKVWLKVPETIRIVLSGCFKKYVSGKDLILNIIRILGVDGATYKALEFCGNISALSMDDRFTVANMAVECGAKNAFFPVDDVTRDFLHDKIPPGYICTEADDGAVYTKTLEINLAELVPSVAVPHLPSNVFPANSLKNVTIQQAVIGSCTNGRLSDLAAAAENYEGQKNCRRRALHNNSRNSKDLFGRPAS
jgi:3-isopropylmalate dehydratase large subunit